MTTDIKELAKRLRAKVYLGAAGVHFVNQDGPAAADALEAMAGEVENQKCFAVTEQQRAELAEAERDRLKAALVRLKTPTNISANERIAIAEEALGGDAS